MSKKDEALERISERVDSTERTGSVTENVTSPHPDWSKLNREGRNFIRRNYRRDLGTANRTWARKVAWYTVEAIARDSYWIEAD